MHIDVPKVLDTWCALDPLPVHFTTLGRILHSLSDTSQPLPRGGTRLRSKVPTALIHEYTILTINSLYITRYTILLPCAVLTTCSTLTRFAVDALTSSTQAARRLLVIYPISRLRRAASGTAPSWELLGAPLVSHGPPNGRPPKYEVRGPIESETVE
jgi:hypothetical protein